jgi:uncharacterized membrane protein YfcA
VKTREFDRSARIKKEGRGIKYPKNKVRKKEEKEYLFNGLLGFLSGLLGIGKPQVECHQPV